jgi:oligoribonuclease (3'-5' exoribonuclease)
MLRTLKKEDGPLVWVDCEMTGLELGKDKLLEVSSMNETRKGETKLTKLVLHHRSRSSSPTEISTH